MDSSSGDAEYLHKMSCHPVVVVIFQLGPKWRSNSAITVARKAKIRSKYYFSVPSSQIVLTFNIEIQLSHL